MPTDRQPLNLDQIETRKNAATPGPWGTHRDLASVYTVQARPRTTHNGMETDGDIATLATGRPDAESYANARFIAHAPEDITALVDEIRRLQPAAALLKAAERYLSALHGSVARHDNLAANLGCAGCELRDKIRAALVPAAGGAGE